MKTIAVNFGEFKAFIKENIGPNKNMLMLEEGFIVSEFDIALVESKEVLEKLNIPCCIVGDELVSYLAVADTKEKIDQFFDSKNEGEFQATFMEVS